MNFIILNEKVGNDTVEGIAFSRDTAVIMTGVFVKEEEVGGNDDYWCLVIIIGDW